MKQGLKTVRVFISSTFRDMHAERDYLVRFIFPELRERCARRGLQLIDVDLRWGVTEVEAEQGLALEICLDEIEHCRPFFIGLLGERYGWVPPAYNVPDEPRYDWMRDFELGHSITALEIYYGVLKSEERRKRSLLRFLQPKEESRAFFYFRKLDFLEAMPDDKKAIFQTEDPSAAAKLKKLKADIRAHCPVYDYVCSYNGLDAEGQVLFTDLGAFGQRVLDDLWNAISAEYPKVETAPDELAVERSYHDSFIQSRTGRFLGREELIAQMVSYAKGNHDTALVVTGTAGCGKSALMARFAQIYAVDNPADLVLSHFVGAGPGSSDLRRMLLRLCRELRRNARIRDSIPEDMDELRRTFSSFLHQAAAKKRVVILIDALDQLDETHGAHMLSWLPYILPSGLRIIVSTLEGDCLQAMRQRNLTSPEINVDRLTKSESKALVSNTLGEYRKSLDERPENNQMDLLLNKSESHNPLYLTVACEELRLFGDFERLTQRVSDLPESLPELFEQVLERLEHDHGYELVEDALSLLASAHHGLLESELLELLGGEQPMPRAIWARLYRSLQSFLHHPGEQDEGLLDFFHRSLGEAVHQRYLKDPNARKEGHHRLADYFRQKSDPTGDRKWLGTYPRCLEEYPYQLAHAGLAHPLKRLLFDPGFLQAKLEVLGTQALIDDYDLINIPGIQLSIDGRKSLELLQGALRLSAQALAEDVYQLPAQLTGRLLAFELADIQAFLQEMVSRVPYPWLRPSGATLVRPDTRIITSWKPFSIAPVSRLIVSDDERTIAVVERKKTSFWDIETGIQIDGNDVRPTFVDVDWELWRESLPQAHFVDEDYHKFTWSAISPPGDVVVECFVERQGTGWYGGQYNVDYLNRISIQRKSRLTDVPPATPYPEASIAPMAPAKHNPQQCPSENKRQWLATTRGDQNPMAQDRAGNVDPKIYKFCKDCDPLEPLVERKPSSSLPVEMPKPREKEKKQELKIHRAFYPERTNYLSAGLIAPAISKDGRLVVCGGLHGAVQVWDSATGEVMFAGTVGPGTIVALALFLDSQRLAILTIEGRLLIADISSKGSDEMSGQQIFRPSEIFVNSDGTRAVLCEKNAPLSVWDTLSSEPLHSCSLGAGVVALENRISADLTISIATAHGEDYYDGWFLTAFDLISGKTNFEYESSTPSERYGELTLLERIPAASNQPQERRRFLQVSSWPFFSAKVKSERGDEPVWLEISTGELLTEAPSGEMIEVPNAEPMLVAKDGTTLKIHEDGRKISVIIPKAAKNSQQDGSGTLNFLPDSQVQVGGISHDGSCVVIACESAVHCLHITRHH